MNKLKEKLLIDNELIPIKDISISKDDNEKKGYDFTVEKDYTYFTHDGIAVQDCMAIYPVITQEALSDVLNKVHVDNNLISPSDGNIVTKPSKDIVLGIYLLTKDNKEEIEYKGKKISNGRCIFNKCLPENYPLIDKKINRKLLFKILNNIVMNYPVEDTKSTLNKIKDVGFKYVTYYGISMSLSDLYNKELLEIKNKLNDDFEHNMSVLNSEEVLEKLKNLPINDIIESGARGNWDQLKQMTFARGYVTDYENKIRKKLIRGNYLDGLNQQEFFDSCYGVRKGLLDTAISTGTVGHLTRQLVYSTSNQKIFGKDCNTDEYLEIFIKDENMVDRVLWRYVYDEDQKELVKITTKNKNTFIGKNIKLRSPIYCKEKKGICEKCMGDIYKILHSNQIGVISSESLSEPIQQLVLQTFHYSGVVKKKISKDSDNEDIINGMNILQKLFHNPESLGIETPLEFVNKLYNIFDQHKKIFLIHYEIIISSMMFCDVDLWRTLEDRNNKKYNFVSVLKIPSMISWVLGCSFSNFKKEIIKSITGEKVANSDNILTELFKM